MTTTLLSSQAHLLRSAATRRYTPRALVQPRRPRHSGASGTAPPSPHASARFGRRAGVGLLASLACSALAPPGAASTLCDDDGDGGVLSKWKAALRWPTRRSARPPPQEAVADDDHDDDGGDGDALSKVKASLRDLPVALPSDMFDLDRLATALGGGAARALASGIPADLSYGFCAGFFSGLALKKVGRAASVVLGAGFLTLQTLAYYGYIEVHHDKLQREVEGLLDRNGDGVVDGDDLKSLLAEVKKVAGFGLDDEQKLIASGGGFGMGFLGGLRSG